MNSKMVWIFLSFLFVHPLIAGEQLPPKNYHWYQFDDIEAQLLRPTHWQASIKQGKLMASLVMQENAADKEHGARFTVNVVSNLTQAKYQLVSDQIEEFAASYGLVSKLAVVEKHDVLVGNYPGISITLANKTDPQIAPSIQRIYLADDQGDRLFVIEFRCSKERWEILSNIRNTMLAGIRFTDSSDER